MKNETRAMLAASAAYAIFGLSFLFSKKALDFAEPSLLLCARFALTFIALNVMLLLRVGHLSLRRKPVWKLAILGFLQPILYFICENYGLKYTTATLTGVIASVSPIFTIALGALLLPERPAKKQWMFALLSIAGVLVISLMNQSGGSGTLLGCLCLVAAYLFGSLYTIWARRVSSEFTSFESTYVMFLLGFVFFTGMAFAEYGSQTLPQLAQAFSHPEFSVGIVYLSLLSSVAAYMLINYSLARLTVARATIFSCMSTVVSVLAGVLILRDPFSPVQAIAAVLILVGVYGSSVAGAAAANPSK